MKRSILSGVALILLVLGAAAQQPDVAQVLVHYKFSHIRNTNRRNDVFVENSVLMVGSHASVYRSYEPDLRKKEQAQGGRPGAPLLGGFLGYTSAFYQFPNEKKMVRGEFFLGTYLVDEPWPVIDWRISHDTATMGGLHCQKATAHFKGRDYTAWFCPDLPLHVGPWKLNGLPGVIVEAWDSKKEVQFTFNGLEKAAGPENAIRLPANATKTTAEKYDRMMVAARKDPAAMGRALTIQAGGIPGKGGPQVDVKPGPGPVVNNPIELPEKK